MPFYCSEGKIPKKRHTQFRKPDDSLYAEEVMGTRGFSGIQSILYHLYPPTSLLSSKPLDGIHPKFIEDEKLEPKHIKTVGFTTTGDPISSRVWLMGNKDVALALSTPTEEMQYFYRNGLADELLFIHDGGGELLSQFGNIKLNKGDYVVIPVGTTYQLQCEKDTRILALETPSRIEVPKRYRNEYGQLLEHSPFCERDFTTPTLVKPVDQKGEFEIRVKMGPRYTATVLDHHPFDIVGWDGFLYPWTFNINDFEPITGRIHQPPPVHQTFYGEGFVVCSFVTRLFDYHPDSIPAPYNHSNVNSDEVIYYVDGHFMSRKGIDLGSFTLHPGGIPHGPHPGTVEASIGKKETKETSVMVDTFAPLRLTADGAKLADPEYVKSWL